MEFNYKRFAEVHARLMDSLRRDRHLTLKQDVRTLTEAYVECGGSEKATPEWFILVACIYALQERLGLPMIMEANSYLYRLLDERGNA